MKKNTYVLAFEACDNIFRELGQIPTIATVKQAIGINSPGIISSAIKDWKKVLPAAPNPAFGTTGIPATLLDAITAAWRQAQALAYVGLQEKMAEIESTQAHLAAQEADLFDQRIRLEHLSQQTEQHYLKEIAEVTAQSISLAAQIEDYRKLEEEYKVANAVLLAQLSQAQEQIKRLETQYNKEHEWALRRIEEEKNIVQLGIQNEISRLQAETNQHKRHNKALQAKLDSALNQNKAYIARIKVLEKSIDGISGA